ncbi:Endonuclease/exonuclease/phosphatase, partial [Infundibulicybe gibba]
IATLNIKGGGSNVTQNKWQHINQVLRDQRIDILSIQETHLSAQRVEDLHHQFDRRVHIINSSDPQNMNAKGVAIVLNKQSTRWREATSKVIVQGRALLVTVPQRENNHIRILAIYAPNNPRDNALFWEEINERWTSEGMEKPDLMLGDFNMVEESLDRLPPHPDHMNQMEALHNLKSVFNMIDGWRRENPHTLGYTYRQTNSGIQSRIDRIYVSNAVQDVSCEWKIQSAPLNTDHRMVSMKILDPGAPYIGKGRWTIPLFVLKDKKILQTMVELGTELMDNIERAKYNRTDVRNAQTLFKTFKDEIVKVARAHAREAIPKIKKGI